MATAKITKRAVEALVAPKEAQVFLWDTEIRGFGVGVAPSGLKTFVVQYRTFEGRKRRLKIGGYGILTVEQARDLARIKLGKVAAGEDPAEDTKQARNQVTVAELCDWYLVEARAGNILGRLRRPIKKSSLDMDESRIRTHIKPLLGHRVAKRLTIADVEQMQSDVMNGKTAKPRTGGRGGTATGGAGVAGRCVSTIQAILGHAKHKGLLTEHPTLGARKLASPRKVRRLSEVEIEKLGMAMALAERQGENPIGLAIARVLLLSGYRREEAQSMQRDWLHPEAGYVAFPDTKSGAQMRAIGPEAIKIIQAQPVIVGNPYVFPSTIGDGPFRSVRDTLRRVCRIAGIEDVSPHTLRHTFGSVAGDLGFSELTIRALLGHASQNVTQSYVHIDEALKLAALRVSDRIAQLLKTGAAKLDAIEAL